MQVDFYYDFGSPTAYIAWRRLRNICNTHSAVLNYRPMLLGGVFKATGNASPAMVEAKGKWLFEDIQRFAKKYQIEFEMNPHFIINTLLPMRGAIWAENSGVIEAYTEALFTATWVDRIDVSDPDQLSSIVHAAGLDAESMASGVQQPATKAQLIEATELAVGRGVFGAPTMFVSEQMHFGQDRIDWVEEALAGEISRT